MRILLVTSRYPWPPRRGDQLRTCQMLDLLAPDHQVTLVTPHPDGTGARDAGVAAAPAVQVVTYRPGGRVGVVRAAATGQPLQSGLFFSRDLRRKLRQLAPRCDLAILQLVRLAAHLDDLGDLPVVLDLIDDLALNFSRRAEVDRAWLRPLWNLEACLLLRAERRLARRAAAVLFVCDRDRQHLARELTAAGGEHASRLFTVGLVLDRPSPAAGVPAQAGTAREGALAAAEPVPGAPAGGRLVFTGNLGYFVNADAICWWLQAVWPALKAELPGVRLTVAGDRPTTEVRRAISAAGGPAAGVWLIESAPDLGKVLSGASVALAPMRCGSGVPIKVLEAWRAGVPVVASPWAAAGAAAVAGQDLEVADTPRQWVDTLVRLLADPAAGRRLADNGRRRLAADYSPQCVSAQLRQALALAAVPHR